MTQINEGTVISVGPWQVLYRACLQHSFHHKQRLIAQSESGYTHSYSNSHLHPDSPSSDYRHQSTSCPPHSATVHLKAFPPQMRKVSKPVDNVVKLEDTRTVNV